MSALSDEATSLWREAVAVDAHNDLPTRILDDGYDPAERHAPGKGKDRGETDLPRLLESGLAAQFFAAWGPAPRDGAPDRSFDRALEAIDAVRDVVARHPDALVFATTADQVRAARRSGRFAALVGVEGGHAIEGSLDKLRALHARGARYLTLVWNNGNAWAGSSLGDGDTRTGGLTTFGHDVVREMQRLGMLVDLSHASDATVDDVVSCARAPVVATHSCARALADHPRNLDDERLRAIARTGGVIGVNFYAAFLDAGFDLERPVRPALARLLDHVEHVARVAGHAHVALGSDFDGVGAQLPEGVDDVTAFPRIAAALLARGWRERDLLAFLGGNLLRVLDEASAS